MPLATLDTADALPQTHCFVSIARGRTIRTFRLSVRAAHASLAVLALLLCWLVASSLYLVLHDDLVASLMAREARTQYAYEDRIVALRGQVEREASLKLVGQTTLDAKLRDLAARATALETRATLLSQIDARIGGAERRIGAAGPVVSSPPLAAIDNPVDAGRTGGVPASAALPKPRPLVEGRATGDDGGTQAAQASFRIRLAGVEERLERADATQLRSLATAGEAARHRVAALRSAIESVGLSPDRVMVRTPPQGTGGPFVPLDASIGRSSFGRTLEAMQTDLDAASGLIRALSRIPFATPLAGRLEITSGFGARLDPFLGRPALHTGVDFAGGYGTEVRATAAGRVVAASTAGGYGLMVEIDHGQGLSTRYAHLSGVAVAVGASVGKGDVVGDVGASGRATGPHLHYETRIDGEAVDPVRFITAGSRLAEPL